MKHYFRPGREDFRQAILRAMPKMLGDGGRMPAKEEIKEILERSTLKTWRKDKAKVLDLLAELSNQSPGSRQMAINSRA
jgi:hypothetical protein